MRFTSIWITSSVCFRPWCCL